MKEIIPNPWNEETPPRQVRAALAPNLKMGLQAMSAEIQRRRALFGDDRTKLGYPAPTEHQLVYFTYVYYNAGKGAGSTALNNHRPGHPDPAQQRTLQDFIERREFANAIQFLVMYRSVCDPTGGYPAIFSAT
jgi:hypothetical protein